VEICETSNFFLLTGESYCATDKKFEIFMGSRVNVKENFGIFLKFLILLKCTEKSILKNPHFFLDTLYVFLTFKRVQNSDR